MTRRAKRIRGTTLIDVVVVAAMVALLLSISLPVLKRARTKSHVTTCLANLRTVSQGAAGYVTENGNMVFAFPFGYRAGDYQIDFDVATEFIWGGGVPDKRAAEWDPSQGLNPAQVGADTYCIVPVDRPLNEYMVPGVWWSHPLRYWGRSERYMIPMELPDFFKCPSDSTAAIPAAGDPNLPPDPVSRTWEWWGTSYACNWYWAFFYEAEPQYPGFFGCLTSTEVTELLFQHTADRGASEFILFYENRLNHAFTQARPRGIWSDDPRPYQGWHGDDNVHAAGFADGSARYRNFDARYLDGPGWTLWPNRPWDGTVWEPYQDY